MNSCVFRATGLDFRVDDYLRSSPFKPTNVIRKDQTQAGVNPSRMPMPFSSFAVVVSGNIGLGPGMQMEQALQFLQMHQDEFPRLKEYGAHELFLLFTVRRSRVFGASGYYSPELISALSRAGMGLSVDFEDDPKP